MSLARTGVIFAEELARTFRRPLFWFLIGLLPSDEAEPHRWGPSTSGDRTVTYDKGA